MILFIIYSIFFNFLYIFYVIFKKKKNFIKKTITELIDENGKHISDQSRVLEEEMNFYKS